MPLLQATHVTKTFGNFTALDQVSIEVNKGEVYGFIGPNGAGKSTMIRILLGILQATSGEATLFGMDAWKDAVHIHKRMAYVPGDVNLWPNLTGGEVIDVFTKLQGSSNKQRKDELMEIFDLDPTKKCRTYSKGNRQKVALVAAFASDAELFIFDEPTSGLDPLMERTFQEQVLKLKDAGKSVLLSSHILSEVEKLCDRVGIIREGKMIETGTLEELRHLTRMHIAVETKKPMLELASMKGVHDIVLDENKGSFQVDTDALDTVMAYVSTLEIVHLESAPPTLEDLFMRHYESSEASQADEVGRDEQ